MPLFLLLPYLVMNTLSEKNRKAVSCSSSAQWLSISLGLEISPQNGHRPHMIYFPIPSPSSSPPLPPPWPPISPGPAQRPSPCLPSHSSPCLSCAHSNQGGLLKTSSYWHYSHCSACRSLPVVPEIKSKCLHVTYLMA